MFTLLRNFRTLFMLTIANYQSSPEGPSGPSEAELKLAEATKISESTREKLLDFQSAMIYFAEEGATIDKGSRSTNAEETKDIQELLNLASLKSENPAISPGKADGDFFNATDLAVKAFQTSQGLEADGIVTAELYNKLVDASGIVPYSIAVQAAATLAATAEASERQGNLQIVASFDWENKDEASEDEIKALQQALQDLGKPVNTIDGVITPGGATEREYNNIQGEIEAMERTSAEQRLEDAEEAVENIAGPTDAQPAIAERDAAEEALERNFPQLEEFDISIPEQSEINDYSRESLSEMNKYEREAVQRDINAVLAGMGEELIAVDGGIGNISRTAMAKIGVYNSETQVYNFVKLVRLAQVARNDAQIDSSLDDANRYHELRLEADDLFMSIPLDPTEDELNAIISNLALLTDVGDDDGDGNDDWTEANKTQRFSMAQYVTDKASRMVDAGTISNEQASQIMLGVLAQEKFESKPGRDAIARMVNNTINDINALTRNEVGQEVASSFSASAAINAIARSNEPMSMRASIDRGFFRVAGQNYDIDRAEDMYIVTGNSAQRVSMRDTVACELTDVAIVGNTIVGMMSNGCEGNVVYIPLDVNTVPRPPRVNTPRVNPPRIVPPTTPITPITPEVPLDEYERCEGNDWVYSQWNGQGTWNPFDDVLINRVILERNDPDCRDDGGNDTPSGEVGTAPGVEGGGDEGGGGTGGGNDGGRT